VLLAGAVINLIVYLRNLALVHGRVRVFFNPLAATVTALVATALMLATGLVETREDLTHSSGWFAATLVGQAFWSSRFILQWWWAERHQRSDFPVSFWWTSLVGNVLLLAYSIHLADPIYISALALGPIVQTRNLVLARRHVSGQTQPAIR
jgi:lipid-A-disaccharide synthase-like uncharacterized protein